MIITQFSAATAEYALWNTSSGGEQSACKNDS